jgi:hypothetical protein
MRIGLGREPRARVGLLPSAYCFLPTAFCLLLAAYCLLPVGFIFASFAPSREIFR